MTLFEYVRRHSRAILFTIAVFAASGVALLQRMPVSLFPDVTFPRIVILADNGEEPAERMMIEVTKPLEEAASSVPGVRVVRSITGRGSTEISVNLDWGSDVQQTLQLMQGRIANIRTALPPAATVQTEQMQVAVFPILGYSLTSDSLSLVDLRDIALYQIRPALMRVNGVARVEITGGDVREFRVIAAPEKLAGYRLDIRRISEALKKTNLVSSAGLVDNNYQLYLSLVSGLYRTSEDIGACVVTVRDGVPVRVSDEGDDLARMEAGTPSGRSDPRGCGQVHPHHRTRPGGGAGEHHEAADREHGADRERCRRRACRAQDPRRGPLRELLRPGEFHTEFDTHDA